MSKVIEKAVAKQLDEHLSKHELYDPFQSAYRKSHSMETALLKVHNDIANALDKGNSAVLVMLDLSAAFDTLDHRIVLDRFSIMYGI